MQARSLRWKQLLLQALKSVVDSAPAEAAADAAPDAAAAAGSAVDGALNSTADASAACGAGCRLCSATETWATTVVIGVLCALAALHAALCAVVRAAAAARRVAAPGWASGVLAGGKLEAGVALVILPGADGAALPTPVRARARVLACTPKPGMEEEPPSPRRHDPAKVCKTATQC